MIEIIKTYWFLFLLPFLFYCNHLWIYGLSKIFYLELHGEDIQDGYIKQSRGIFWRVAYFIHDKLGYHLAKPFVSCPACMSSIHSTYYFWIPALTYGFHWWMFPLYLNYTICLTGLNYLKNG